MKTVGLSFCMMVIFFRFSAQDTSAVQQNSITATMGIYDFDWHINPELVDRSVLGFQNDGFSGSGINNISLSPVIRDSVIASIEKLVGEKVPSVAKCIYRVNKNGQNISTWSTQHSVGGLPTNSRNKAIRSFERDYYADVFVRIDANRGIMIGSETGTNVSRLRPYVVLKIKVFDQERKRVYRNRVRIGNFDKITRYEFGSLVLNGNGLSQKQISNMVFVAIEALRNK
ncbi:MAG: hypothetical protein RL037_1598 [Bacteroidota bacterium]